jgi:hypothetical protein
MGSGEDRSPVTRPGPREPGDLLTSIALVGFYSALGYVLCGILRSVRGDSGIALSPLLGFAVFSLLAVPVFWVEDRLQSRED